MSTKTVSFILLVSEMRKLQRRYFLMRNKSDLYESKKLEGKVDREIARYLKENKTND